MIDRLSGLAFALVLVSSAAIADGESVVTTKLLETSVTNTGRPIVYPATDRPAITVAIVEIAPGASTPVHRHPNPLVGYILEGTLEVTADDGTVNVYEAGDALVEALDQDHQGRAIGDAPVRVLITVMGEVGEPISVLQE
jgi:quercetin dioxygenase-like cupin family protein